MWADMARARRTRANVHWKCQTHEGNLIGIAYGEPVKIEAKAVVSSALVRIRKTSRATAEMRSAVLVCRVANVTVVKLRPNEALLNKLLNK